VEEAAWGVARGERRALDRDEFARLLRMPDRRTTRASVTSPCCTCSARPACGAPQAADLLMSDVDERRRFSDPRLRPAIARSTSWWVTVRYGKRRGAARAAARERQRTAFPRYVLTRRRPDPVVKRRWSDGGRERLGRKPGCESAESQDQVPEPAIGEPHFEPLLREGLHGRQDAEERRLVEAAGRGGRRLLSIASLCVPPAR
jgi:hypothetical protein